MATSETATHKSIAQRFQELALVQRANQYLTAQNVPVPEIVHNLLNDASDVTAAGLIFFSAFQHPLFFTLGSIVGFGERTMLYKKNFPDNKEVASYQDLFTKFKVGMNKKTPVAQIGVIILFIMIQWNAPILSIPLAVAAGALTVNHMFYEAAKQVKQKKTE